MIVSLTLLKHLTTESLWGMGVNVLDAGGDRSSIVVGSDCVNPQEKTHRMPPCTMPGIIDHAQIDLTINVKSSYPIDVRHVCRPITTFAWRLVLRTDATQVLLDNGNLSAPCLHSEEVT